MRQQLLGMVSDEPSPPGRVRRFPRLRGGSEGDDVAVCGGIVFGIIFFFFMFFCATLEPNEYGLTRNFITGAVNKDVSRGGLHILGPFRGFVRFPAAQMTLEFSARSTQRPPVMTRTGADPNDPDSGGQPIQISCAIQFEFVQDYVSDVYLAFGSFEAAMQRYLLLSGNMVSNTAQDFVPTDFWARRDVIAERMLQNINATFWRQGRVIATRFEIMKVDFARKFEDSITAIQVAEQSKVVNEYEQQVQQVVQTIEVMRSKNNAMIANISAGADATAKEMRAGASRDAFALKQGMKATKYAQLQKRLGFTVEQLQEFFKIHVLQGTNGGKVVIGLPGMGEAPAPSPPPRQQLAHAADMASGAQKLQPPPQRSALLNSDL